MDDDCERERILAWWRVRWFELSNHLCFRPTSIPLIIMSEYDSVVLETSMGDIQLELYWEHAPKVGMASNALRVAHHLFDITDMQELRRAGEEGLLQRNRIPPYHRRTHIW